MPLTEENNPREDWGYKKCMFSPIMFSSKSEEWETPQELFDEYNIAYNFILDVCATKDNTKCTVYFDKEQDGLKQDWGAYNGYKWMNPPYGKAIKEWVMKAAYHGKVVALLPARTDTKWFHEYCMAARDIRFLKGRLKFGGCKNSAPFPSMIVIF